MKKKIFNSLLILLLFSFQISAQTISGYVKVLNEGNNSESKYEFLPGANVYWFKTTEGTKTNSKGYFTVDKNSTTNKLIISYIGFKNDTIDIKSEQNNIEVILQKGYQLEEVKIEGGLRGQYNSETSIVSKQVITSCGLYKLPCCNLSESFENNAGVDVSYSDAVSGAKQIKLLGLAGEYTQILREAMPGVRGLSTNYGLAFLPGQWLESVQISKGTSTVVNGYESITGQINTELKKPEKSEKLFVNIYGNSEGRTEANLNSAVKLNDKLSTMILAHGSIFRNAMDHNNDGFSDMPLTSQLNLVNRWKYLSSGKLASQIGIRIMKEKREGGQIDFLEPTNETINPYGININNTQYEVFGKLGFPLSKTKGSGIGSQYSYNRHEQNSFFGNNVYSGVQNSFFANIIFQTNIKTAKHNINAGASFIYDDYAEEYNNVDYLRTEKVPGLFAQYTYNLPEKLSVIIGVRTDFHNLHGLFFTPRLHVKYNLTKKVILRASAGKGYRTANIFSENQSVMASSRVLNIREDLLPEEAWNYGVNLSYNTKIAKTKELNINIDYYRTDFVNQVIADIDENVNEINFYNLNGRSYSNSFQAELSTEIFRRFEVTAAFRITDVKVTMHDELINKPFAKKYKGLVTLSYATKYKKWLFDVTNQFVGKSQLPNTSGSPSQYQLDKESPAYYILHAQITKNFKHFAIYLGGENLTNFKQKNPIIASENPFGNNFDASMIWGPVMGRMFYAGIRIKIK